MHVCMLNRFSRVPILCHPMDCSPPGSSVHRILQARILELVAMPSSRGLGQGQICGLSTLAVFLSEKGP